MSEQLLDRVADLTECPICRECMRDPRILHCVHTFCRECLVKYSKGVRPGEKLACPVCRAEFIIPERGLDDLPKNFIVEKLCDARNVDDDWQEYEESNTFASRDRSRRSLRGCGGSGVGGSEKNAAGTTAKVSRCPKHLREVTEAFCCQCEVSRVFKFNAYLLRNFPLLRCNKLFQIAVCQKCKNHEHKNHQFCSIDEFYDDFKKRVHSDLKKLETICGEVDKQGEYVDGCRVSFIEAVRNVKEETARRAEEIKLLIDRQLISIHEELDLKQEDLLKECDVVSSQLQLQKTQVDSFKTFTTEVIERADPSDLACNARDIKCRATELLGTRVAGLPSSLEINLEPLDHDLLEDSTYNLIGQIEVKKIDLDPPNRTLDFDQPATLIGCIENEDNEEAVGVTVVNTELFVAIANSAEIKVYDAMSFQYKSKFLVETLAHPSDLASTKTDLFVFDNRNLTVHKVEIATKYSVNWSIQLKNRFGGHFGSYGYGGANACNFLTTSNGAVKSICGPSGGTNGYYSNHSLAPDFSKVALSFAFYKSVSKGFSLTPKGTVLLVSPSNFQREIIEFTSEGRVLREISLCFFVHEPRHIAMLDDERFLICYGSSNYVGVTKDQMCLIDSQGRLIKRWSPSGESETERDFYSYVCDYRSGKQQALDPSPEFVKKNLPESSGLGNSAPIFMEKTRGRLFVTDSGKKNISVFQLF
ncbi:hypothetical protein HELRODRAFT_167313 [Helobdella robusta]|uniref:RING-type domain-containing protein n=1 Tax=Helobdella robusta TaxID=6412 RepID=T1EZ91_HELRO|nr:hypothetical protein HELRODRAFT_167313 [Helobdella robusta]ESO10813.1 hypothetical protein HELRODRAFT_167313 [Helobdella robusta]